VPDDHRLPLIGDADYVGPHAAHRDRIARRQQRALENLLGVVLHPAWLRIVLRDFLVPAPGDAAVGGDYQCSSARRALVYREDVLHRAVDAAKRRHDRPNL